MEHHKKALEDIVALHEGDPGVEEQKTAADIAKEALAKKSYKGQSFRRPIHGTYPFDTENWEMVRRELSKEEAAKLVGIPDEEVEDYMWINKGYLLINTNIAPGSSMEAAFVEQLSRDGAHLIGVPVGTEAVYLGDGVYYLIRKVR